MYYFRLARSAIALWIDEHRPLLTFNDVTVVNIEAVLGALDARAGIAPSAYQIVHRWAADVEQVNKQRSAIDRVSGLPVTGKELREWIQQDAAKANVLLPSMNQVRRRLGAWFRGELRDRLGPIYPPQDDLGSILIDIGRESRSVSPQLRSTTTEIVAELLSRAAPEDDDLVLAHNLRSDGDNT